ncbi:MAG: hypothetical protein GX876_08100 [Bacteroidales bacterium]|nr:hypothetical protein [Bacteroidales bacterium]
MAEGLNLADTEYNRFDTLESDKDLSRLFDVVRSFRDQKGNSPAITANVVIANPDFKKIRESDFSEYHFEPVAETLTRYPGRNGVISLWKSGNEEGVFHPQFHSREHVNVPRWMEALNRRSQKIMVAFDNETTFSGEGDYNFMEVLDFNSRDDLAFMKESLIEGLDLFEDMFGYRSLSFIPPCYTWDSEIEETLHLNGVRYIQGLFVQSVPTGTFYNYRKKYHFLGNKNIHGQYYLIRNAFFEPSLSKISDPVGECLQRINIAFKLHKPAIICTHRINFMGELDPRNRDNNLELFRQLLDSILKAWPNVEFMTSDKLGDIISCDI